MQYIIPKNPHPFPSKATSQQPAAASSSAPQPAPGIIVTVKALRTTPPLDLSFPSQPAATTSVLDIKTLVSEATNVPADKLRLLHKKKPVSDTKVLAELTEDDDSGGVEFAVMFMGGAVPSAPKMAPGAEKSESSGVSAAQARSGGAVVQSDEFWSDLRGFLVQRIKDEKAAAELFGVFRGAWEAQR